MWDKLLELDSMVVQCWLPCADIRKNKVITDAEA
jgi:hypothetical protein